MNRRALSEGHVVSAGFAERSIFLFVPWVNIALDQDLSVCGDIQIHGLSFYRLHGFASQRPCHREFVYSAGDLEDGSDKNRRRNTDHRGDIHSTHFSSVLCINIGQGRVEERDAKNVFPPHLHSVESPSHDPGLRVPG